MLIQDFSEKAAMLVDRYSINEGSHDLELPKLDPSRATLAATSLPNVASTDRLCMTRKVLRPFVTMVEHGTWRG